jgi:MFS family permease
MANNVGDLHPGGTLKNNQLLIYLIYFGFLGFAFLLVEIPLIQGFILYMGHPAYALTSVLFTLLLFSGFGSWMSKRIPARLALGILVVLLLLIPIILPHITNATLGFSLPVRIGLTIIMLAPIGFLMGIPFPAGITLVADMEKRSLTIPWIWGVNGSTSVVSSVLAALIALSCGFSWVFRIGALCYTGAWIAFMALNRRAYPPPPPR